MGTGFTIPSETRLLTEDNPSVTVGDEDIAATLRAYVNIDWKLSLARPHSPSIEFGD
jgi:hypothetical protein